MNEKDIQALLNLLEQGVENLDTYFKGLDNKTSKLFNAIIDNLNTENGKIIADDNFYNQIAKAKQGIDKILDYTEIEKEVDIYLKDLSKVVDKNVSLYDFDIDTDLFTEAQKQVFLTTKAVLIDSIAPLYKDPLNRALLSAGLNGATISQTRKAVLEYGNFNGIDVRSLSSYATQLARDSAYGWQGTISNIIRKEYDLNGFIYSGGLIADSRTVCKKVKALGDEISFVDLKKLLDSLTSAEKQGMYPSTDTVDKFLVSRGGYNCRHICIPIRIN